MTNINVIEDGVLSDLRSRPAPRRIYLDALYECNPKDYIGYFADSSHYDTLIQEDCDVYVGGVKAIAFRKGLFPRLKDKDKQTWEFLRWASRDMYSGQRGLAAGKELVTNMESRVTNGLLNFFKAAKEGKPLTYASVGPGSFYHLLGEHLSKVTRIEMTHVPYKGAAPAEQDLMGSQVDIFLAPYGKKYEEMHKTGKLKVLAVLNSERLPMVKDFPAISESKSLKDFTFTIWTGYFVKKDTPEPIVQVIHKAITDTLSDAGVRSGLEANSQLLAKPLSLSEVGKVYADGTAQFRAIAKSINLQPQ